MPQLAIGIPTRNRRDMLLELLEDIVRYAPDISVVISDNSPDDDTETAIAHYKSRLDLTYFHVRDSLSQAENFNFLLSKMNAEYALLMHDDDRLFSYSINNYLAIINYLKSQKLTAFGVYVKGQKFSGSTPVENPQARVAQESSDDIQTHLRIFKPYEYLAYFAESGWGGRAAGVLIDRAALATHQLTFPTDVGAKHDKAFFLMANLAGLVAEWQAPIIAVRLHEGRSIHRKTAENYILFNRKIEQIYAGKPEVIAQIHRQRLEKWQSAEPRFMPLNYAQLLMASQLSLAERIKRLGAYLMRRMAYSCKSVLAQQ